MKVIVATNLAKCFRVYERPADHLKEILTLGRRQYHEQFWAVREVGFEVDGGTCLGIVGENGSGKSTLLGIVAGVIRPTSGEVRVAGRVSTLLELGAGFDPEFTGRDNVFLNASILGLTDDQTRERMPSIEEFADIGKFVDRPVKTYSTGMFVRLAFAVAIHMDPDVLIVDEALSVGDIFFQQRCIRKIHALKERGVTILFVSHDLAAVRALADQTIWMEHGAMKLIGPTDEVTSKYLAAMVTRGSYDMMEASPTGTALPGSSSLDLAGEAFDRIPPFILDMPNVDHRYGNGKAKILGIGIFNREGRQIVTAAQGDRLCVRISLEFFQEVEQPNVGFMIRNRLGEDVTGTNVLYEGARMEPAETGDRVSVDFIMDLPYLSSGFYHFCPAVADGTLDQYEHCDWVDNAYALEISERTPTYGHMRVPFRVRAKTLSS